MAKTVEKEKKVAAAPRNNSGQGALLVEAIKGSISSGLAPLVTELKASNDRMAQLSDSVEELKGLHLIQAAASRGADEDEDDDVDISAAKEEDDEEMSAKAEEEDDEEAAADDDPSDRKSKSDDDEDDDDDEDQGEDDDLDAMEDLEKEAADQEPGQVNKDAENKGDKTTVTRPDKQGAKVSGNIAEGRLKSSAMKAKGKPFPNLKSNASIKAAAVMVENLQAQVGKLRKSNKRLNNQILAQNAEFKKEIKKIRNRYSAMEAQAEKWAEQVDRRSAAVVSPDLRNMMAKVNIDPHEILAGNAEPLSVQAADQMFKVLAESGIQIDPVMRATYKNRMNELGLMESGEVPYARRN